MTTRGWAALAVALLAPIAIANAAQSNLMKIGITVNGKAMTATLINSETTRDFVSLLPLTLTMNDLFAREKSGDLPRSISEGGERRRTYEIGQVIYWSPSAHLAIYYRHDGQSIPSPGIIVLGKIDIGVEALNVPGPVTVTIEPIKSEIINGNTIMSTFTINGSMHRFEGDPDMPLLWYLRDIARLSGTKFGCGQALCGACTLHLDGVAVRSWTWMDER
jgi:hypothetical protein